MFTHPKDNKQRKKTHIVILIHSSLGSESKTRSGIDICI